MPGPSPRSPAGWRPGSTGAACRWTGPSSRRPRSSTTPTSSCRPVTRRALIAKLSPALPDIGSIAVAAVPARTAAKYGADRAGRYVDLEAGHAAQNVLLEAVALGLGGVPIGAFDDRRVAEMLGLPAGEEPRYLLAVGHPR